MVSSVHFAGVYAGAHRTTELCGISPSGRSVNVTRHRTGRRGQTDSHRTDDLTKHTMGTPSPPRHGPPIQVSPGTLLDSDQGDQSEISWKISVFE